MLGLTIDIEDSLRQVGSTLPRRPDSGPQGISMQGIYFHIRLLTPWQVEATLSGDLLWDHGEYRSLFI